MFEEDEHAEFYNAQEDEERCPCFQVTIDKEERKDMIFLIDGQETLSYPLSKLNESYFTVEKISGLIKILRTGNLKKLYKELKGLK
jgi:hypothetical protein